MEPLDEVGKAVVKSAMTDLENYILTGNLKYLSWASDTLIDLYWSRNYADADPYHMKEVYEKQATKTNPDKL